MFRRNLTQEIQGDVQVLSIPLVAIVDGKIVHKKA